MMKLNIKRTYVIITFVAASIGFIACGEGDSHFKNDTQTIPITIACTTPAVIDTYITLQSNDVIVKDSSDTSIIIYHDQDNIKKVCLESGSAHIVR